MNYRPSARVLLVCFAMVVVLFSGSCARKRKVAAHLSKETPKAIAPVCALEVSAPTVSRGDHLGISAKASALPFTDKEVTWKYRWEVIDPNGRVVPINGAGAAIDVPTARLACGSYRVMTTVTAVATPADCSGDCVTNGQTTCTATFEVTEAPCAKASCEITVEPRGLLRFRATATGLDDPAFTWHTTSGSLSSATGAEVILEPGGPWPSSITVTVNASTGRTRCDQPCPGASSSVTLATREYADVLFAVAGGVPLQRPSGRKHYRRSRRASETPTSNGGNVSASQTTAPAHAHMKRSSGNQPVTAAADGDPDIDTQLERLKKANAVFNTPESMTVGETRTIQLLLGLNSVPELEGMIQEPGKIERATSIRISNQMEAKLSGDDFSITEITPTRLPISMKEANEWRWDIKPEKSGTLRLELALNVILFVEGNQLGRTIQTFKRDIKVPVVEVPWSLTGSILGFIKSEWKWLWTVLVAPLVPWIWKRLRKTADAP
jgi:hypothetical protein